MVATVKELRQQEERRPITQLGVGVVSRNVVDATIDLAIKHGVYLTLIASRRQIDMDDLGAGYVEGWDAERLAEHVRSRGGEDYVLLGRDHGGPWQNPAENDLDADAAMASSIRSFQADIDSGFRFLHIDPSVSNAMMVRQMTSRMPGSTWFSHTTFSSHRPWVRVSRVCNRIGTPGRGRSTGASDVPSRP